MIRLLVALTIATIAIWITLVLDRKWYAVTIKQIVLLTPVIIAMSYLSSKLLFFVENRSWGGASLFGGVLLLPIWCIPLSKVTRIPYGVLMDLCSPAGCAALAVMKCGCLLTGCCRGRIVYWTMENNGVRFPSQVAEICVLLVLLFVTYLLIDCRRFYGKVYPYMMVMYGGSRFLLNWLRETKPFIWILPAGNFWSIIAVVAGLLSIIITKETKSTEAYR